MHDIGRCLVTPPYHGTLKRDTHVRMWVYMCVCVLSGVSLLHHYFCWQVDCFESACDIWTPVLTSMCIWHFEMLTFWHLAAELASTVCQGSNTRFTEFLVYDGSGREGHNWTAANRICQADNGSLPTNIEYTGNNFSTSCISHLLQRFPTLSSSPLYLWRQPCATNVRNCPAYTINIKSNNISNGIYARESTFGPNYMALLLCEKGEHFIFRTL